MDFSGIENGVLIRPDATCPPEVMYALADGPYVNPGFWASLSNERKAAALDWYRRATKPERTKVLP